MRLGVPTLLVCLLFALSADAGYFTFTGRFTSNRGQIINFPAVGNTGCGGLTLMSGPNGKFAGSPTPATHPFTRGVNTVPTMMTPGGKVTGGIDRGCVKHAAGKLVQTTGTMAKVGAGFALPTQAWFRPFPASGPTALAIKYATGIVQLATSFRITGPQPVSMLGVRRFPGQASSYHFGEIEGGTMANSGNLAPWLALDKLSMIPASMRSGRVPGPVGYPGKFTWCPGAPDCLGLMSAPASGANGARAIIKYSGGGHSFGGTMSYLIRTGPNVSSLALAPAGSTGPVSFQILDRSRSQPTGRGYAQLVTRMVKGTHKYLQHMEGIVDGQKLITSVMGALPPAPDQTEFNYGFPFTTKTVLVRHAGTFLGNPRVSTITAMGSDMLTGLGGRNISLVAGGIGITNLLGNSTQTPEIASMLLNLPEPGGVVPMLACALGLIALARWRSHTAR